MIKRFNLLRFGFTAVQMNPASVLMDSPSMDKTKMNTPVSKQARKGYRSTGRILAVLAVIALLTGGGWYYYQRTLSGPPMAAPIVGDYLSNEQLEAQYGLRIELIAVTFGGGVIDFRYRIVDPLKANALLHDPGKTPILTALDKGLKLYPSRMMMRHHQRVKRNYVPYRFFPNARNAVKPGTPVAVSFGDVRVGPIIAQ